MMTTDRFAGGGARWGLRRTEERDGAHMRCGCSVYGVWVAGIRGEDFVCLFVLFVGIGGFALSLNAKPADCRTWG